MKKSDKIISIIGFWLVIGNLVVCFLGFITLYLTGRKDTLFLLIPVSLIYFNLPGLLCGLIGWVNSKESGYTNRLGMSAVIIASIIYGLTIIIIYSSPAALIAFLLEFILNPLVWAFIIFWIIYKRNKKRWARITAIVLTGFTVITSIGLSLYRYFRILGY